MELTAPAAVGHRSKCASTGVRGGLGPDVGSRAPATFAVGERRGARSFLVMRWSGSVRPSSSTWPGWPSSGAHGGAPPRLPGRAPLPQRRAGERGTPGRRPGWTTRCSCWTARWPMGRVRIPARSGRCAGGGPLPVRGREHRRPGRSAVPPVPDAEPLRSAGVPLVPAAEFQRRAGDESDRRSRLAELVRSDGWSWPGSEISPAPRTAGPSRPRPGR
jgi:hypothetical protein